jgi:hypothetical protein
VRRSGVVREPTAAEPSAVPNLARSIAFAREARRETHHPRPSSHRVAVLGLFALAGVAFAGFSHGPVHRSLNSASLGAAADVPAARIREVDVMRKVPMLAGLLGAANQVFAQELVVNGGFESVVSQNCGWICLGVGSSAIPGWSVVLNTVDRQKTVPPTCMPEGWLAFDGEYSIDLNGCSVGGAIEQSVAIKPGSMHRLTFALTVNPGADNLPVEGRLLVRVGKQVFQFTAPRTGATLQTWYTHSIDFTPTSSPLTLRFESLNQEHPGQWAGPVLDAVSLKPLCPGDVVANGVVDGADLAALLSVWGTDGGIYPRADSNGDGFVDAQDLAVVLGGWGACP